MTTGLEMARNDIPAQAGSPSDEAPGFSAMVVADHPLIRESMAARLTMIGARADVEAAPLGEPRPRAASPVRTRRR